MVICIASFHDDLYISSLSIKFMQTDLPKHYSMLYMVNLGEQLKNAEIEE